MNVGDVMLSEKTRVGLNLATFISVIIFFIVTSSGWGSWKTGVEKDINRIDTATLKNTEDVEEMKALLIRMDANVTWMVGDMETRTD